MFVRNNATSNLILNTKGQSITLTAQEVTYIPDAIITETDIKRTFGNSISIVTEETETKEYKLNTEQKLESGHLYLTQRSNVITPSLYISSGSTANIYGSCSQTQPEATSDMDLPDENTGVSGYNAFAEVPKYIVIDSAADEIIVTNLNCYDLGAL